MVDTVSCYFIICGLKTAIFTGPFILCIYKIKIESQTDSLTLLYVLVTIVATEVEGNYENLQPRPPILSYQG